MHWDFNDINYWSVLVAAVAAFIVGGVWYGLLFAKLWVKVHALSEEQVKAMAKKQPRNLVIFFITNLVTAFAIGILVMELDLDAPGPAAAAASVVWLAVASIGAAKNVAHDKPLAAFLIDTGHDLAILSVMGVIIGAWAG